MYDRTSYRIVFASILAFALAWLPMTAIAADDTEAVSETGDQTVTAEVTLDDMTVDQRSDAAQTNSSQTFQQVDESPDTPGMASIIALNALWGGIAGGLVGTGVYLLTGMDMSPWVIAQFAGGGVLVGGTVGLISALVRAEPDPATAELPDSVDYVEQHAPATLDIPVMGGSF